MQAARQPTGTRRFEHPEKFFGHPAANVAANLIAASDMRVPRMAG